MKPPLCSPPPAAARRGLAVLALAALAALAACVVPRAAHATPPLRFSSDFLWFDAGHFPRGLAAADFDGDGVPDFATANPDDDGVSLFLGRLDGTLAPRLVIDGGADPVALATADLDGDGVPDLVVANGGPGTLTLLRNRGGARFAFARALAVGASPIAVLARDVTGDGLVDLVVIDGDSTGTIALLRGEGHGAFGPPQPLTVLGPAVAACPVGLIARGRHGLAVAEAAGGVSVLVTTDGARFEQTSRLDLPGPLTALVPIDFEREGRSDLVVAAAATSPTDTTIAGSLFVLHGKPNGEFVQGGAIPLAFAPSSLVLADVDQDGRPDLVTTDRGHGRLAVLRGDGQGGFAPARFFHMGSSAAAAVACDWNGDGRPDLAAVDRDGLGLVLLPGDGAGRFGDAPAVPLDFGPGSLRLGDLDGDGAPDLAAVDPFADRLAVLRGDGHGGFAAEDSSDTWRTPSHPAVVAGAPLLPGGPVTLVVAHGVHDGFLSVWRNQGGARFTLAGGDTVHTGGLPTALALGDVNQDGFTDAVVADAEARTIAVCLGDGAGRFHVAAQFNCGGLNPVSLALGDVDEDGRPDLVVADEDSNDLVLFHGLGTGGFQLVQTILTGPRPRAVALARLDADPHLDLVAAGDDLYPARGLVAVYTGDGHGGFAPFDPGRSARVGFGPAALVVEDLDRDGVPDVAVANEGSSTVTLLPGRRAGGYAFGPALTLGTQAGSSALAAGDVDGDGRTDLAVSGLTATGVSLLVNRTGNPGPVAVSPAVDVEPGACPNVLRAQAGGFVRAALPGGAVLPGYGPVDPATVPADSVTLEGVPAVGGDVTLRDVTRAVALDQGACACGDRAPDGLPDAVYRFDAQAVVARLGSVPDGESRLVHFVARLPGGYALVAEDCVTVQGGHGRAAARPDSLARRPGLLGPNPLRPGEAVAFTYRAPADGAPVLVGVYAVNGRRVATLASGPAPAGPHTVAWDGRDDAGARVAPGVYFVRADAGGVRGAGRVVIAP